MSSESKLTASLDTTLKQLGADLRAAFDPASEIFCALQDAAQKAQDVHRQLALVGRHVRKQSEELRLAFGHLAEVFARLPEGIQLAQSLAAERGWCWGHSFVSLAEMGAFAKLGRDGDAGVLEAWMVERTRAHLPLIRDLVLSAFPKRSVLLHQAFEAHEREHYGVSVPTMLAQAEGIYSDLLAQLGLGEPRLFSSRSKKDVKRKVAVSVGATGRLSTPEVSLALLSPLFTSNVMWSQSTEARDRQRTSDLLYDPLNRNGVLHGIDIDYPTERKAFCAVSLLGCLEGAQGSLERLNTLSIPDCTE